MSTSLTDKARIHDSLEAFASGSLAVNAVDFLHALGYRSDKTLELEPNTAAGLLELANRADFLNAAKAHVDEWQSVDFLFQLTDEEIRNLAKGGFDFDSQVDVKSNKLIESYIFFAVELRGDSYPRGVLADITREINRLFPMPALVLFKHGKALTLSIINRRIHKRDAARDVLEKVTLIKDIRIEEPHRGQVEILFDLAFPQLVAKFEITNFVQLDDAWRKTLDTSELNKRFYKDLANWYFWALRHVAFPKQEGVADEVNRATNVIRLITRLIFVWFLKERELVPDALFDRNALGEVLKDLSADKSTFYKAILQNLFFATLNTPMSDEKAPRAFRQETNGKRFNHQYMVHNQYRHEKLFKDSGQALEMFAGIPFLNGGLFECLDKREEVDGNLIETRIDGFSDMPKKQPTVPNKLFFGPEEQIDLNDIYGTSNKRYTVRGLIDTLDRYKFTIAENTPIEEEVALDPELLGKVFENLLASYNPETGATARKQTGSFYSPREIVNYMVDESLIAYLETQLATDGDWQNGADLSAHLRQLFAYTDEAPKFSDDEVEKLIASIDGAKMLDPACGSGAFPMGILQKLVFILSKLDPNNAKWEQRQIDRVRDAMQAAERIEDHKFREDTLNDLQAQIASIEEAFARNELDYGRKLFLIENCIYGIDIQAIAIQIAKLRFFISLIIDQRIRPEAENLGIRPLPNLETKFVAANTLLDIKGQIALRSDEIAAKEKELKKVREEHFRARTTRRKNQLREADQKLRQRIGWLIDQLGLVPPDVTQKLIGWNPYDQNKSADFFDPEWMFGVADGFGIVIGNPPYVLLQDTNRGEPELYDQFKKNFTVASYKVDLYHLFIEQGIRLLGIGGSLTYITPSNFVSNKHTVALRRFLLTETSLTKLVFFEDNVFEASVNNLVLIAQKPVRVHSKVSFYRGALGTAGLEVQLQTAIQQDGLINERCLLIPPSSTEAASVLKKMEKGRKSLGLIASVNFGMQLRDRKQFPGDVIKKTTGSSRLTKFHRPCYTGKDISKYLVKFDNRYCYFNREAKRGGCWDEKIHLAKNKILIPQIGAYPEAGLDTKGSAVLNTAFMVVSNHKDLNPRFLVGLLNSLCVRFFWLNKFTDDRKTFPKIKGEYLKLLPIPRATPSQEKSIINHVNQILAAKDRDDEADTTELELAIDQVVYDLYELTPEERVIVEASAQSKREFI